MGHGLGTVTRDMIYQRAREIALVNGRAETQMLDADVRQALRELTREFPNVPDPNREEAAPESARWDPVHGSEGRKTEPSPPPDEQTFAERLVQEGIEDAEHDQMVKATRESIRRENEE